MNTHQSYVRSANGQLTSIEILNNFRTNNKVNNMAKSNLLKEAIADAKAVRETAIANAKIALEEAFTPRLQSILSQKLQKEIEDSEDEDDEQIEEEYGSEDAPTGDSTSIGAGSATDSGTSGKQPSGKTTKAHTELGDTDKESSSLGSELDDTDVVREGEGGDEDDDGVIDDPTGASVTEDDDEDADDAENQDFGSDEEPEDEEPEEDELDLEAIIRELEGDLEDDDESDEYETDGDESDEPTDDFGDEEGGEEFEEEGEDEDEAPEGDEFEEEPEGGEDDDDIDLDEILREMGYGDDDESGEDEDEDTVSSNDFDEKEEELEEAYGVIRSLKGTINEVNLLNAKLLYSNKLFRSYELTNEQKMKVIETLDRTSNVREVKLVFATLAESLKIGTSSKRTKTKITESFASNAVKSTAPKQQIINESNAMSERFQQLANIKKNVNG